MGRNLSPILRRELENLDKDADSRKSAMKALKSYVKDLDSKAIPQFLAQVSETKENGSSSGEYTISLYEVLARVHGPKIVSQIDNIMSTIIKTLSCSAGSFALHQACSKVVPAIARYGIEPTTPDDKKRHVIHSLCKPLSDSLLGSQESLSSGSALCLNALVDSDNWRFASDEMVNEVCQKVAGTLGRPSQTNSHIGLVMSLAKHNSLIVEAYARLLIHAGLGMLNAGVTDGNSQKRLSAIQMVNFLMKSLDFKSVFSELGLIIEEMEKSQSDQMPFVRGAAFEALQTARRIVAEKGPKYERDFGSVTGSNFGRRENGRRSLCGSGNQSPRTASPESQTIDSFGGYDFCMESPTNSTTAVSRNLNYDQRSANRKLWKRYENGGVDVSLSDGFYSEMTRGSATNYYSGHDQHPDYRGDYADGFRGFSRGSPRKGSNRSNTTPSPQRSRSHINIDNVKIFTTPRKLIHSLQEPDDVSSESSEKQTRRCRSPVVTKLEWGSPTSEYDQNCVSPNNANANHEEVNGDDNLYDDSEQFNSGQESVSSTEDDVVDANPLQLPQKIVSDFANPLQLPQKIVSDFANPLQLPQKIVSEGKIETRCTTDDVKKSYRKSVVDVVCSLFVVISAVCICLLWIDDQETGYNLAPT